MRRGLVLIELLLVVVITGLMAGFAAPRIMGLLDATVVRDEAYRIVTALDAARGASMRLGVPAVLTISDSSYRVTAAIGTDTVLAWRAPGSSGNAVILTGAGAPIAFGPAGLAMGVANRTITLARGTASRRVVISRLGRLTY